MEKSSSHFSREFNIREEGENTNLVSLKIVLNMERRREKYFTVVSSRVVFFRKIQPKKFSTTELFRGLKIENGKVSKSNQVEL